MEKPTLVVIVPAYNEAERIGEAVTALSAERERLCKMGLALRVYVVNDGSKDDTTARAQAAGADRVVRHRVNQGLGAAVRSGIRAAVNDGADLLVKFDADLQHDPADIPALIRPILDDEADVVYGNRFERIEYRMPIVRRLGNIVFTGLMRWLTRWPLRDSQPGIFAINRAYMEQFYLPGDYNYTQQILLDAYHKGMRFAHVPVAFRPRTTGRSFVSYKYPMKVLPQILMVLVGVKPLRVFGSVGAAFLLLAAGVFGWDLSQWLWSQAEKPAQHVNLILGLGLFGLQTLFFGILADLIVKRSLR